MKNLEERTKNEGKEILINLTQKEKEQISNFLLEIGLRETQVETVFLLIDTANGKVYFESSHKELSEKFFVDPTDDAREKKRRKTLIRSRIDYFEDWQEKKGMKIFEVLALEYAGRSGKKNRLNPYIFKCDLCLLKKLINIRNASLKNDESGIERLRKEYLTKLVDKNKTPFLEHQNKNDL